MKDRPPWRCRTDIECKAFKAFIYDELALRFMLLGGRNANAISDSIDGPPPDDQRRKLWHLRALAPVELAARAVPLIRDIFEDYWAEGREAGRLYRGHDPSVEDMAAEFGEVTRHELEQRLKKAKERRPAFR